MPEELKFPVMVHFKVIGEDTPDLRVHLEIALSELSIKEDLVAGRNSSGGRYITYNLSVTVENRQILDRIDARLRAVAGVKLVL